MTGRFAPSPTGRMHIGNIYSALLSWLSAKGQGGEWILRIEDLDPQRSRREYALQIEDDLRWLGLQWDRGGTADAADGVSYMQSHRTDIYAHYLNELESKGVTYPCYCTRADILAAVQAASGAPHESDGRIIYPGTCRPSTKGEAKMEQETIAQGEIQKKKSTSGNFSGKASTRLIVPDRTIHFTDRHYGPQAVNLATHCGDFVLRRADGAWAYQLAVVVDDALMGVTEVVRGRDLLLSSAQQIYLYELLGFPAPSFAHLPLLINEQGQRLSKRDRSLDMQHLRSQYTPEQLIGIIAHAAHLIDRPEPISLSELLSLFSWSSIPTADILVRS